MKQIKEWFLGIAMLGALGTMCVIIAAYLVLPLALIAVIIYAIFKFIA